MKSLNEMLEEASPATTGLLDDEQLKKIVRKQYDAIHAEFYDMVLSDEVKAQIERRLIESHLEFLYLKGKEQIKRQEKILRFLWHPDKKQNFTAGMLYIDGCLGAGQAFNLIENCVGRSTNHLSGKKRDHNNVPHDKTEGEAKVDDLLQTIIDRSVHGATHSERFFYKSVLEILKDSGEYAESLNKSSPLTLAALLAPFASSIYCVSFFAPEIILGLAISQLMSNSAGIFDISQRHICKKIAINMREWANYLFYVAASLPMLITTSNITMAHYAVGSINSTLRLMTGRPGSQTQAAPENPIQLLPLKLIASHLENYIDAQTAQWAAGYREGASKTLLMRDVIADIIEISKLTCTLAEKFDAIEPMLAKLRVNPVIMRSGQHAVEAIKLAETELHRARESLTSAEDRKYYDAYHGTVMPLKRYLDHYQHQWIASWRKNANVAKRIKLSVNTLEEINQQELAKSAKLNKMHDVIVGLYSDMHEVPTDDNALKAITESLAATDNISPTSPRPRM